MRSLVYIIDGKPRNLDDCIDYVRHKEKPKEVLMNLDAQESANGEFLLRHLIGKFIWKFSNIKVNYEEFYGGCIASENIERQKLSIDNANRRLEAYLEQLDRIGIEVKNKKNRFNYNQTYMR